MITCIVGPIWSLLSSCLGMVGLDGVFLSLVLFELAKPLLK